MKAVRETAAFRDWLANLRDTAARHRIQIRISRLSHGNAGSHRVLRRGLRELRIDVGPGYRVYYVETDGSVLVLLAGGNKATQRRDIAMANEMLDRLTEMH